MNGYLVFGIVAAGLLWGACHPSSPDAGTEPRLDILHIAGEMPEGWNFLPYPTHYGRQGAEHVFLLTKAPNPGSTRSYTPIGVLSTTEDGKEVNWIIANDALEDFKIDGLEDVNDLMTNHNGIKSTLERWIINRKGIGQVMLKGWKEAPRTLDSNNQ